MSLEDPTKNTDESHESADAGYDAMMERHNQAKEYVQYHLPEGASRGVEDAAMLLVDATEGDLKNENYWKVGIPERLQLNATEVEQLTAFVDTLKRDRGWVDSTEVEEVVSAETGAGQSSEAGARETVYEAEPHTFESPAEAYETMQANLEAMTAELDMLEPVEDDPYQTLRNLFAVLKKHSVRMQVNGGDVVEGLPLTLQDSHLTAEEREEWGNSTKVSSGSISNLQRTFTVDVVSKPGFRAEDHLLSYTHPQIVSTLNRLFANQ